MSHTRAPEGGKPDESFIQRQGGHLEVGGNNLKHTQDFILNDQNNFQIESGAAASSSYVRPYFFFYVSLGSRIIDSGLFQTYRITKAQILIYPYQVTGTGTNPSNFSYMLSSCPYSRDTYASGTGSTHLFDIRNIVSTQSKYIQAELNTSSATEPQTLKVPNEFPQYAIGTARTGLTSGDAGKVYSSNPLSITNQVRLDASIFTSPSETIQVNLDIILKVTIEFEGLHWFPGYSPASKSLSLGHNTNLCAAELTHLNSFQKPQ